MIDPHGQHRNEFDPFRMEEIRKYLEIHPPSLSIEQLQGYARNIFQEAPNITTSQTTTSTSPADLATVGPTLGSLQDGKYAIFLMTLIKAGTAGVSYAGVKVNSTEPSTSPSDSVSSDITAGSLPAFGIFLKTLSGGGSNTLTVRYWTTAGTATYANRRMVMFRYSNP